MAVPSAGTCSSRRARVCAVILTHGRDRRPSAFFASRPSRARLGREPGRNTQAADRDQPWYWMPAGPWLPVLPFLGGEQPLPGFVWQADEVDGDAEVLEGLGGPRIGGWHERGVRLADRRGTAAAGGRGFMRAEIQVSLKVSARPLWRCADFGGLGVPSIRPGRSGRRPCHRPRSGHQRGARSLRAPGSGPDPGPGSPA